MAKLSFGKQVLRLRQKHDITQARLAHLIGVSSLTVSRWEREACQPRYHRHLITEMDHLVTTRKNKRGEVGL